MLLKHDLVEEAIEHSRALVQEVRNFTVNSGLFLNGFLKSMDSKHRDPSKAPWSWLPYTVLDQVLAIANEAIEDKAIMQKRKALASQLKNLIEARLVLMRKWNQEQTRRR